MLGWPVQIRSLASFDEAPGDSPHSNHSVPPMCQWTGRMAVQTVEGHTYGAQPSVTIDQGPPSDVTGNLHGTKRGHRRNPHSTGVQNHP